MINEERNRKMGKKKKFLSSSKTKNHVITIKMMPMAKKKNQEISINCIMHQLHINCVCVCMSVFVFEFLSASYIVNTEHTHQYGLPNMIIH